MLILHSCLEILEKFGNLKFFPLKDSFEIKALYEEWSQTWSEPSNFDRVRQNIFRLSGKIHG